MKFSDEGTVADYAAFLRRRLRFIIAGTIGSVAVMAAVTSVLPKVYTTWAVIDAGTLGERLGLDGYRNRFNDGGYLAALANFPAGSVRRAWMLFASPKVMIRVDAADGGTATAAARVLAERTVRELSGIAVPPPRSSAADDQVASVRGLVKRLRDDARAHSEAIRDRLEVLGADPRELIARVRDLARFERTGDKFEAALDLPVMREAAVSLIGQDLHLPETSLAAEALADAVLKTLQGPSIAAVAIIPVRLSEAPTVPHAPDWPSLPLNLAIAFVFGLVGSTFAAVLAEREG